jgi:tRNA pseudouridine38-40 synthase
VPRIQFTCEYDGSGFAGWQVQPGLVTVQSELERSLEILFKEKIQVVGSGRTDAGVHALGQRAHFDLPNPDVSLEILKKSMNALTSEKLSVRDFTFCDLDFHARYSARSRIYRYQISTEQVAIEKNTTWCLRGPCDPQLFLEELKLFLGTHDFNSLSIPRHDGKGTLCTILNVRLEVNQHRWMVWIEGNRFLHRMVRSMVGACVDVGRKKLVPGSVKQILEGNFSGEWTWAPAQGLCLMEVKYD